MKNNIKSIEKEQIDTSNYKYYDFFYIFQESEAKTGIISPLKENEKTSKNIFYISAGTKNNACDGYVNKEKYSNNIHSKCLTMGTRGEYNGNMFYQDEEFVNSNTSMLLKFNHNLNIDDTNIMYISLFISSIWNNNKIYGSYGIYPTLYSLKKDKIKLPSILNQEKNEYEPDWKYMKEYITDLLNELKVEELKNTIDNIKGIKEEIIDTTNWKKFNLIDIFDIKRGKRLRSIDRTKGNLRYFSSTSENNGVSCYIGNPLFIENNSLIFNTFGNVFYSEEEFSGSDEITILKNTKLNNKNGLFLSTIMSKNNENKYGYSNKAFYNEIIKEEIYLPSILNETTNEFEPDWIYMEEFIKSLPYNKHL